MRQIFTTDYDFRKTYYRNFYDNRKAGIVKGSKYGKLARVTHANLAATDTREVTVWNDTLQTWVPGTGEYIAAVDIQENFKDPDWEA